MDYVERHLRSEIDLSLKEFRVVSVVGPRQAGKSTLTRSIARDVDSKIINLDNPLTLEAAKLDPLALLSERPALVVVDEIQRAPELLLSIKEIVDDNPRVGQFLITGSANIFSLPKVGETLTGRVRIIKLMPLSQGEIHGVREVFIDACFGGTAHRLKYEKLTKRQYFERIIAGGFPDVVLNPSRRKTPWFTDYVQTSLDTLREIGVVERALQFENVFDELVSNHGGLTNYENLARRLNVGSEKTIRRYHALLETLFLSMSVSPWGKKYFSTASRAPKNYISDSGLAATMLGETIDSLSNNFELSPSAGPLLEGFVIGELQKQRGWNATRCEPYHFRTHSGNDQKEIDVILENAKRQVVGIEVKASTTPRGDDFKSLISLRSRIDNKFAAGILLYSGDEIVSFGDRLWAMPISTLWGELEDE